LRLAVTAALVTGASGTIGTALGEAMADAGFEVTRTRSGPEGCEVDGGWWSVDLRRPEHVDVLMAIGPAVVVHCAARWSGINEDYAVFDDNIRMTLNVLRHLPPSVRRFVYLSSSAVSRRLPGTYAAAKAVEEHLVEVRCRGRVRYTVWRPYHVVSPHEAYRPGRSHLVTNLTYAIIEERAGRVDLRENGRDCVRLTWVDDVVAAVVGRLQEGGDAVYDVGVRPCVTIEDVAAVIVEWALAAGLVPANPVILGGERVPRPCEPYHPDVECPTPPLEAVRRSLARRYADRAV
jgi:nucleoside-diphosphate-sugar epimerase